MRVNGRRMVGVVLVVAAVASIGQSAVTTAAQRRFVQCQGSVNEALVGRTRILTEVGAQERDAERARDDALDATFLDPSLLKPAEQRTPAEAQRVRELYLAYRMAAERLKVERAAADRARAEHPVPPPPSELCG